ncbi:carbonic anhydrase [Exidia glandulosa HHB12029]|uniref:Carbonic anhydrase n=1 Tax=Exidia glandulosa HHB12029 TaxID=1314781 RepID=A0A165EAU5_EXIGL|nr:carbonic anhydrase [Exidia glandulosa HHB12029]
MFTKVFISLALAAAASASCIHGTSLQRRQEGTVPISNFGYSGERGPLNWAGLDAANVACRTSQVQSPIVLDNTVAFATEVPQITIAAVEEAEFENLGTTLETIVSGTTVFGGKTFNLKQFHMHTPSEHRINEEYFPLEIHMVHEADDGTIGVIAIPFQLTEDGSTTALLTSVITNIAQVTVPGTATKTGPLDFAEVIAAVQAGPLFQYTGSLTTPPCAEGLTFLVLEKPLALDVKTYNTIKSVIKFNARYTQNPLGQTNLLDVAVKLAVSEDPTILAAASNASCAALPNGSSHQSSSSSQIDVHALIQELVNGGHEMKFDTITTTTTTVTKAGSSSSSHAPGTVIISNPGNGHVQTQAMPSSHSNIQVINTKPVIIDGTMPVHISKKDKMVKRFTPAGKRRL